ncbi:hypothetical protein DFJ73DRAFT_849382 [Zopfochytrium polystomum]|nr:hypothetical protein DFJ73DRAFT_849382 [Zopfochytrium polystomum]
MIPRTTTTATSLLALFALILLLFVQGVPAPGCYYGSCFRILDGRCCFTSPSGAGRSPCSCPDGSPLCHLDSCVWNCESLLMRCFCAIF